MCKSNKKKTTGEFKQEVYNLTENEYIVLGEYINANEKIEFLHTLCGTKFYMRPHKFLQGQRCTNPKCLSKRISLKMKDTEQEYKLKFDNISKGEYELLSDYISSNKNVLIRHIICNNTFEMRPNNFQQGQRCPFCFKPTKGEQKIINYLESNNIEYTYQKKYDDLHGDSGRMLSYDFYLPAYNLLIEYQGEFHDGNVKEKVQSKARLEKQKEYDNRKRQYAIDNNIELLEIWYQDFRNIENILNKKLFKPGQAFKDAVK